MLPDFPELKSRLQRLVVKSFKEQVMSEGLIAIIPQARIFEGDSVPSSSTDGHTPLKLVSADVELDRTAVVEKGPTALLESLQPAVEEHQRQMSELILQTISEASAHAGNSLDAGGGGLTQDLFLSFLERMDFPLAPDGKLDASGFRIVAAPDLADKLGQRLVEWNEDDGFKRRLEELADRKRAEQVDRESNRRLVD